MKLTFYLAGKYSNRELLAQYASILRSNGYYVNAEWLEGCHALSDIASQKAYATTDFADIDNSDYFVMVNFDGPSAGRNIEFGYALAKHKRCYIIGEPTSVFHHLVPSYASLQDFLAYAKKHIG